MGRAAPVLLALALALPSANFQLFDGLPASRGPEFLVLALLIPLAASRGIRRRHRRWVQSWPDLARRALAVTAVVALGAKLALLASGTAQGFLACYGTPLDPPPTGPCERSFENAFFRFAVTRLDRVIEFGERDWNLGFLNTVRLDRFYAGLQGRLRQRLPIEASWRGEVERPQAWVARISYVGEATVAIDPGEAAAGRPPTVLAPRYGAPAVALIPVPAGRHGLRIDYRFDDGSTWGGPPPDGPWATLRVERGRGTGGREPGAPVTAVRPAWAWLALAALGDLALVALAAPVLLFYAGLLWRDAWWLALVGGAAAAVDRFDPAWIGLSSSLGLVALLAFIASRVAGRRWRRRLVSVFFAILHVAWLITLRTFPRLDVVTLRDWASDPLFFESHARSILETWSLQGGEPVFIYQPLFRYVRFAERLLLGDGDGLVSILALAALYWALCWAFARLCARPRASLPRQLLFGGVAVSMLALASTPPVVFFVQASLSEYPTWTCLALFFPMLFASRSPTQWRLGATLASACQLLRVNQAPAVLGALAIFATRAVRIRPRAAAAAIALGLALLTLPALHNWYYGRRLSLVGDSPPQNLRLPPSKWLRVFRDHRVQVEALNHVDHVFYLNPVDDPFPRGDALSRLAMRALQVLWLATAVLAVWRRGFLPGTKALLFTLPWLYLGIHLVYVVDDYYPRHVIAGHLAMGLVALNAIGRGWPRQEA